MIPRPQMPSVNQWHDRVVREATACGEVVLPSVHREVYGVPVTGVCEHKQLEATFSWSVPDGPVPPTVSFARHHTFIHHKTSAGMVEWPTGFLDGLHERFDPEKSVTLRGSRLGIIYCVLIWVTHVHVPGQGLVSVSWHHLWRERDGKDAVFTPEGRCVFQPDCAQVEFQSNVAVKFSDSRICPAGRAPGSLLVGVATESLEESGRPRCSASLQVSSQGETLMALERHRHHSLSSMTAAAEQADAELSSSQVKCSPRFCKTMNDVFKYFLK